MLAYHWKREVQNISKQSGLFIGELLRWGRLWALGIAQLEGLPVLPAPCLLMEGLWGLSAAHWGHQGYFLCFNCGIMLLLRSAVVPRVGVSDRSNCTFRARTASKPGRNK